MKTNQGSRLFYGLGIFLTYWLTLPDVDKRANGEMDPLSQGHQKTNAIKQREGTAETHIDVPHTNIGTTKYIKTHKHRQIVHPVWRVLMPLRRMGRMNGKCAVTQTLCRWTHVAMVVPLVCYNISILFFVFGLILCWCCIGNSFPPLFLYLPPFILFQQSCRSLYTGLLFSIVALWRSTSVGTLHSRRGRWGNGWYWGFFHHVCHFSLSDLHLWKGNRLIKIQFTDLIVKHYCC